MKVQYPNIKQSFGLFGMYLLLSLAIGVIISGFGSSSFLIMLISLLINGLMLVIVLQWKQATFKYLFFTYGTISVSFIIVGCLFSFFLVTILDPLTSLIPMPDWIGAMFEEVIQKNIWSFLTVVVVAPVTEELLFRKVILTGLEQNYGARRAILWSAFFFAVFHLNPWQGISAFLIGIFLAWLYLNTRNIWLCIAIHAFNNGMSFVAFYLSDNTMFTLADIVGYDYKLAVIIGLSLASLYFCYKYFDQAFRQNLIAKWNEDLDATEQAKPSDC